jgi:hypothetical protein
MTPSEETIWKHKVAEPSATAEDIARIYYLDLDYVKAVLSHVSTPEEVPERVRLLKRGIELTAGDRNKTYGDPWSNLTDCAMLWEAYLSAKLSHEINLVAEDVANMMALVKMTRSFRGNYHDDNYLDGAVYMAIAGECRKYEETGR